MTTIESKRVEIEWPPEKIYSYVRDMHNFEELLPKERISEFVSDGDSCSFKIQGLATIGLKVKEEQAPNHILLESTESPFDFTLDMRFDERNGNCTTYQVAELDLNPMMKMMVKKPLTNLFDHISDRLKTVHS